MAKSRSFRVAHRGMRFEMAMAFALLAPFLAFTIGAFQFDDLSSRGSAMLFAVLAPLVGGMTVWIARRYVETGELVVNDIGMGLKSEVPAWLGAAYQRPWSIRWKDVDKVAVFERMGLVRISRRGSILPLAIRIPDWVPAEGPRDAPKAGARMRRPDLRATELWKVLEERGLFASGRADGAAEAVDFDLAKHPATRGALIVMAVLAGYWAIDVFVATEAWAEWNVRYLVAHLVAGALGAAVAFVLLNRAREPQRVPVAVALALAAFTGFCVGLASWTGLVRVNQAFGGPLEPHPYVRNDRCDTLIPVEPGLPAIEYTAQAADYWCRFPKDKRHTVLVRKGLGGLHQVDLREHTRAIREFRAKGK